MLKQLKIIVACIAALAAAFFSHSGAHAQGRTTFPRTWVALGGMDTGTCPISAPCASFQYAIDGTSVGGEVTCLTSGGFNDVTITKTIVVNCAGTLGTNSAANSSGRFTITTAASDRVVLRGLDLQLFSLSTAIRFNGAGTLVLDQIKATSWSSDAGFALRFEPNGAGKLVVTNSLFTNAGVSTGAGILISPFSGGTAQVMLDHVTVAANAFGIAADGANSNGGINMTVKDSTLSGNAQDGLVATSTSGGAPIGVTVINSVSSNNAYGIRSIGSNVTVRVQGSQIIGNGTGLSGGGALLSGGGNTVQANGSNGSFTGSYTLQ